jgi:pyruvate-formate lyase-activating enzyme
MTVDSDRWRQGLNNGHSMTDRTDTGSNVSSEQAERCDNYNERGSEVFTFGGDQALLTKFAARLAG